MKNTITKFFTIFLTVVLVISVISSKEIICPNLIPNEEYIISSPTVDTEGDYSTEGEEEWFEGWLDF